MGSEHGGNSGDSAADRIRRNLLILRMLEQVDAGDDDPQATEDELWARIESSLGAPASVLGPKESPTPFGPVGMAVEYWIDSDDILVGVGSDWATFAQNNDAAELAANVSGRSLWSSIDGEEITQLWKSLVSRVREVERRAQVPFRCDGPAARRWFRMIVTPEVDGWVHFRSVLAFEEARPPVAFLDINAVRDEEQKPIPLCGLCGRGKFGGVWLEIEETLQVGRLLELERPPPIAHGVCQTCRSDMLAEL